MGFSYVIRITPDVWVEAEGYRGNLRDYPVKQGVCRVLKHVNYRKKDPVRQQVVVHWRKRLPKGDEKDEKGTFYFLKSRTSCCVENLHEHENHEVVGEDDQAEFAALVMVGAGVKVGALAAFDHRDDGFHLRAAAVRR